MRNTVEYETKLRDAKRSKQLELFKRRTTGVYNKLKRGITFTREPKANSKRKIILPQEIATIKETSPISIHLNNLDISPEKKSLVSRSSSSYSSGEDPQNIHSKNQADQSSGQLSEIQELTGSRRSALESPTSEILIPRSEFGMIHDRRRAKNSVKEFRF